MVFIPCGWLGASILYVAFHSKRWCQDTLWKKAYSISRCSVFWPWFFWESSGPGDYRNVTFTITTYLNTTTNQLWPFMHQYSQTEVASCRNGLRYCTWQRGKGVNTLHHNRSSNCGMCQKNSFNKCGLTSQHTVLKEAATNILVQDTTAQH